MTKADDFKAFHLPPRQNFRFLTSHDLDRVEASIDTESVGGKPEIGIDRLHFVLRKFIQRRQVKPR
ncbi:hypothetical protein [Zoogloea sp.]|uniref:hypothetical protein n=1 Tax=Zoogloea sp. TaxID=49181 RepID=UPI0035B1F75B